MKKVLLPLSLLCMSHVCWGAAPTVGVNYSGVLVAEPCVIPPGAENIELDFGTVVDKYLYLNQRTAAKPFEIRLADCDLNQGTTVSVSFSGTDSQALPGLLALSPGSQATGIAIGIATAAGESVPLNMPTAKYELTDGNNVLRLKAYIQGEPLALANKSIVLGNFSSVTTFVLNYE